METVAKYKFNNLFCGLLCPNENAQPTDITLMTYVISQHCKYLMYFFSSIYKSQF